MKKKTQVVDLEVIRHHQTDKAVLVSLTGERKSAVWLPLAAIEIDSEVGCRMEIQVSYDLAFEKGLI